MAEEDYILDKFKEIDKKLKEITERQKEIEQRNKILNEEIKQIRNFLFLIALFIPFFIFIVIEYL